MQTRLVYVCRPRAYWRVNTTLSLSAKLTFPPAFSSGSILTVASSGSVATSHTFRIRFHSRKFGE